MDVHKDNHLFENQLILNLAEFIQTEGSLPWIPSSSEMSLDGRMSVMGTSAGAEIMTMSSMSLDTDNEQSTTSTSMPTHNANGKSLQVTFRRPELSSLSTTLLPWLSSGELAEKSLSTGREREKVQ